jgi:hypothetical protein
MKKRHEMCLPTNLKAIATYVLRLEVKGPKPEPKLESIDGKLEQAKLSTKIRCFALAPEI